jgi:hypothetical protein
MWGEGPRHTATSTSCLSEMASPFLVGCHCAATSGVRVARLLATETFLPLQHEQPQPLSTRIEGFACHSWSRPMSHRHQYFLCVSPVLVGCHYAATSGARVARLLVTDTFRPLQHGQPVPWPTRSVGLASHLWTGPASHRHQYLVPDRDTTSAGIMSQILVKCDCAATSGARVARLLVTHQYLVSDREVTSSGVR